MNAYFVVILKKLAISIYLPVIRSRSADKINAISKPIDSAESATKTFFPSEYSKIFLLLTTYLMKGHWSQQFHQKKIY